jgi:hypothetical protein
MTHNSKQEYKLYIELFCEKIKMPYLVFALIFASYGWILILMLCPSGREAYVAWLTKDLGLLWSVTGFWMLIMIRRLRDISIEKFLDPDMPYPQRVKENMQKYLYAVFSPYKFKEIEAPQWFKRHSFFFNHLYFALLIALIAGTIGFRLGYLDPRFGLVNDIIGDGIGVAGGWFFVAIMGFMMIGIIFILRELSKELKSSNRIQSFASIVKIRELKVIPLNVLYSYAPFMISFPAIIMFLMTGHGPWMHGTIFLLIVGLSGFFITLIIPSYYVHLAMKSVKEDFKSQIIRSIKNVENEIRNEFVTERDLEKYEVLVNMIERVERVKTWPLDFESVTKIVIIGIVGSIPAILQYFLK